MTNFWTSPSTENARAKAGSAPAIVWLIGGGLMFLYDGGFSRLLSLDAIAFLVIGMFAASIIVGAVTFFFVIKLANYMGKKYGHPEGSPEAMHAMMRLQPVVTTINLVLSALFLLWVYNSFYWMT